MARINTNKMMSPIEKHRKNINAGYGCILTVLGTSILNVLLIVTGTDWRFLFSGFIPTLITIEGYYLGAVETAEGYLIIENYVPLLIAAFIAVLTLVPYLVSALIYKKHTYGAVVTSLVTFAIDSLVLLLCFYSGLIVDVIFHVVVLVGLISALVACIKLEKLGPEAEQSPEAEVPAGEYVLESTDESKSEAATEEAVKDEETAPEVEATAEATEESKDI